MPPPDRAYHHGDLRAALIRTALELLERRGPDELSLRGLAETAGVSRSAPYSHFRDKRELLGAIAEVGFERFAAEMLKDAQVGDARERFLAIGRGYVGFALGNPSLFKLMFSAELASLRDTGELRSKSDRAYEVFRNGLDAFLHHSGAEGPSSLAFQGLAWSCIHGLSLLLLENRLPVRSKAGEALVDEVTGLFTDLVQAQLRG